MTTGTGRISTGIEGLDQVLRGGYPEGRIMLIEGAPGTGKTTLALQFLIQGVKDGKKAAFFSVAQSRSEVEMIADSHGMSLDGIEVVTPELGEAPAKRSFSVQSSEADLVSLMDEAAAKLEASRPDMFVFDSLLELRLLSERPPLYRRELLSLRRRLRDLGCTALLVDHLEPAGADHNAEGIVHGVIKLENVTPPIGIVQRQLTVLKMRGAPFTDGRHDFRMVTGGLKVFPRVIPEEGEPVQLEEELVPRHEALARLLGGGLEFGTTLLIAGQSGTGKSTLATLLAETAASKGIAATLMLFEERPEVLRVRSSGVGLDLSEGERKGLINLMHFDPAEVSPGEFSNAALAAVEAGARVIVIDSISGYLEAMTDRSHLTMHLHSLLKHLARRHVLVVVTMSQLGLLGETPTTEVDSSFLADSVILLRQYESGAEIRRSIAVLKKRHSDHARNVEELIISPGAVEVRALSPESRERVRGAAQLGAD